MAFKGKWPVVSKILIDCEILEAVSSFQFQRYDVSICYEAYVDKKRAEF